MAGDETADDLDDAPIDLAGAVHPPTIDGLPDGFQVGVTRYADVILQAAFPERLAELIQSLDTFAPTVDELRASGGGRTVFVKRFDDSLAEQQHDGAVVWGKRNITIEKALGFDGANEPVSKVRGHEIDMFGIGSVDTPLPGVAVEMEWNNKDPFYDRDLLNFQALHHEGAIAVGVIVTRGPVLQRLLVRLWDKYGQSSTHWDKLIPRVNLGGGGECPLLLVGIEPPRIGGLDWEQSEPLLDQIETYVSSWKDHFDTKAEADAEVANLKEQLRELLPAPAAEGPPD